MLTPEELLNYNVFPDQQQAWNYITAAYGRFVQTSMLAGMEEVQRAFEFGANPYFLTLILEDDLPGVQLDLANWFGRLENSPEIEKRTQVAGEKAFDFLHFNAEDPQAAAWTLLKDSGYDLVLFCEILEHMLVDPAPCMRNIHDMLRPDGRLVLTTPNVFWKRNKQSWDQGRNIYEWYSPHGPHGRHNRIWASYEIQQAAPTWGFAVETLYTGAVSHGDWAARREDPRMEDGEGIFAVLRRL